jgi:CBS domain-containing protein
MSLPPALDGVAAWLGYINLVLLVFNLLPALPLDGGRILRSFLWQVKGSFSWATRVAAGIGRLLGGLIIALALFMALYQGVISGIWLAFVGWFLLQAAAGEGRFLAAREALAGLKVGDLMTRNPVLVSADLTLARFMGEVVWSRPFTTYPVVEDGRALGLVPVSVAMEVPRSEWADRRVRDIMVPRDRIPVFSEDDGLDEALEQLGGEAQHGVVVDGDSRIVGVLSASDVARALEGGRRGGRVRGPIEI